MAYKRTQFGLFLEKILAMDPDVLRAEYFRPDEGMRIYHMGRTPIMQLAEEAGAGWIVGIIVFVITAVCWLFGQFNAWYQPVIGIMIAVGICFLPIVLTDFGSSAILKIKGLLHSVI